VRFLLALLLCVAPACTVVDAPETLEELVVFGFVHFDESEAFLRATADNLIPLAEEHLEELQEGYYVDLLTAEDLEATGVEAPEIEGIIGALGSADFRYPVLDVIGLQTRADKADLYDNIDEYIIDDIDGDIACFLDGHCRKIAMTLTEVTVLPVVGAASSTHLREFRWVRLTDGSDILCSRGLNPVGIEFTTPIIEVRQQYSFYCSYPAPTNARRLEALWVDAYLLGADLPIAWAVDLVVGEMQGNADRVSDLLDEM
jgi:hypothetical protein